MEDKHKLIYEHYGFEQQIDKLDEECRELLEAISDLQTNPNNLANFLDVLEEMADVRNVIFNLTYGNPSIKRIVEDISMIKVFRQLKRMEEK